MLYRSNTRTLHRASPSLKSLPASKSADQLLSGISCSSFRSSLSKFLFQMFNLSRPQDFEGHSLSVSDVIALKRNGEVSVHYVDSIGFKELPGFLDKQPERPSVLMNLKEKCDAPECNPTVCRKVRAEHEL